MRVSSLLTLALYLFLATSSAASAETPRQTVIEGGGLPYTITLTAADEEALSQRVSPPPRLENPPVTTGPSYQVTSPYWPKALPGNGKDRPPADTEAAYYPNGGFVRARQGDRERWIVLDLRQRSILDRYIALGERGLISSMPSVIEMLSADYENGGEFGLSIGRAQVSIADQGKLLASLQGLAPRDFPGSRTDVTAVPPASVPAASAWLVFALPEGRDVRLLYTFASETLVDYVSQDYYAVPPNWLASVLGPDFAHDSEMKAPLAVPQESGTGSPIWWPVMIGGGAILIALAVLLSRRFRRDRG
jgi:hypothetical protein